MVVGGWGKRNGEWYSAAERRARTLPPGQNTDPM